MDWVNLRGNTHYTLGRSTIREQELVDSYATLGHKATAITDTNMGGSLKFFKACKIAGIKPIIGIQLKTKVGASLIALATSTTGYRSICHLSHNPYNWTRRTAGIIYLYDIADADLDRAAIEVQEFSGELYIEIHDSDDLNPRPTNLAITTGRFLVPTGSPLFTKKEDRLKCKLWNAAHDKGTMLTYNFDKISRERYIRDISDDWPANMLARTVEIAERCNFKFKTGTNYLPKFADDEITMLRETAQKCMLTRYGNTEHQARLDYELDVIENMGYPGYFLITWDFIKFAREKGIPVGPARGSAAGSLVSYCLEITDICPMKHGLLFERFLNPERIGLPDIDIDFDIERRSEVIDYCKEKYGADSVSQIITFTSLQPRAAVKEVGRVTGKPFHWMNDLSSLIPAGKHGLSITIKDALDDERGKDFKKRYNRDPEVKKLVDLAKFFEGMVKNSGVHAAGVIIAPKPVEHFAPIHEGVCSFDKNDSEDLGLLKFDFLGLKNLTIMRKTLELANGPLPNMRDLDITNKRILKEFGKGNTGLVFQFEGFGVRQLLKDVGVDSFDDIVAANAINRPGPLESGMNKLYAEGKAHPGAVRYNLPIEKQSLESTFGALIYQEQVMQLGQDIGDMTLAQADLLRRAMGKKKKKDMDASRRLWDKGVKAKKLNTDKTDIIWKQIEKFAAYGFNKSHSAAYSYLAFQTMYLKVNYPLEFLVSYLNIDSKNSDAISAHIDYMLKNNIPFLPIDINKSQSKCTVENNTVRLGLNLIKNIKDDTINALVVDREEIKSYVGLCGIVPSITSREIVHIIKAGAADFLPYNRATMCKSSNIRAGIKDAKMSQDQEGLRGLVNEFNPTFLTLTPTKSWSVLETAKAEEEVLGFYLKTHPVSFIKHLDLLRGIAVGEMIMPSIEFISKKSKKKMTRFVISTPNGEFTHIINGHIKIPAETLVMFDKEDVFVKIVKILPKNFAFSIFDRLDIRCSNQKELINDLELGDVVIEWNGGKCTINNYITDEFITKHRESIQSITPSLN